MKKIKMASSCYVVICFVLFIISVIVNKDYFNTLSNENVLIYQLKQVGAVLVLFGMGYLFMKLVQCSFRDLWIVLLAFPSGIAIWVFLSFGLLITDTVYYQYRVYLLYAVIMLIGYLIRKKCKVEVSGTWYPQSHVVFIVLGTAFLVSTGWNFVVMNYDSYLYFADYGKSLTLLQEWKAFSNHNSYVLTNIGQFLPLVNSYTAFWGLDYCLPVQSFLMLNTAAIFAVAVWDKAIERLDNKKAYAYTLLFLLLGISCTALLVYSNWLLSNAFLMVYLFLALLLGSTAPKKYSFDYAIAMTGALLSMALLRKDGIIICCFVVVCYCCKGMWNKKKLTLMFLPAAIAQLYYIFFVKKVIYAWTHTAYGTSILKPESIILIVFAVIATLFAVWIIIPFFNQMAKNNHFLLILIFMIITVIIAIVIKFEESINHIDAIFHVLLGSSYGFSILSWGIFVCIILLKKPKVDYELFVLLGYCLLTFLIYWNKGNIEKGIDNSGMRAFYQIIPMIYYVAAIRALEFFDKFIFKYRKEF